MIFEKLEFLSASKYKNHKDADSLLKVKQMRQFVKSLRNLYQLKYPLFNQQLNIANGDTYLPRDTLRTTNGSLLVRGQSVAEMRTMSRVESTASFRASTPMTVQMSSDEEEEYKTTE
jgi:chorismate-pyruvate lyase